MSTEDAVRRMAMTLPPCDLGSTRAIKAIAAFIDAREKSLKDRIRRLRQQRNEARAGVVKSDWWNREDDPDVSYGSPSDFLDDAGYGDIVELSGSAVVETIYGFRLGPAPDATSDDYREVWCNTAIEAERRLDEMRAADAIGKESEK